MYAGAAFNIEVLWDITPCLLVIVIDVALSIVRVVHCFWGLPRRWRQQAFRKSR